MNKKIYIIGPTGAGKSTFASKLSDKYHIKWYELDKVSWDDENGNVRRPEEEALKIFSDILKNDSWIIEDVGRDLFKEGRKKADIIYYLKHSKLSSYYRITKRSIRQVFGLEKYNCEPSFKEWKSLINTAKLYHDKEKETIESLQEYKDKLVIITNKDAKEILNK